MNKVEKKSLYAALALAMTSIVTPTAQAALVADGNYQLRIAINPGTSSNVMPGTDGAWNSTFRFGGNPPSIASQGMFNSGPTTVNGRTVGVNDAYAGVINITVTGGNFTVTSFQVDPIFGTAVGTLAQYGTLTGGGMINQTTGALVLTPTGRLSAFSGFPNAVDGRWNVDDFTTPGSTAWVPLTTGSASTRNGAGFTTINGADLSSIGDTNGDGITDFKAVLVSGGQVGSDFGGAYGGSYLETWQITLVSSAPLPTSLWLLGSGLAGLLGVSRRKSGSRNYLA